MMAIVNDFAAISLALRNLQRPGETVAILVAPDAMKPVPGETVTIEVGVSNGGAGGYQPVGYSKNALL